MSLPGLSPTEALNLQRSVGSQNSEFKTVLTPIESGEYIIRSLEAGATYKEIALWCNLSEKSRMIQDHKNLILKLEKKLRHFVAYGDNRSQGQITFDAARFITSFDKGLQEQLVTAVIEYRFTKTELEGIRQKIERSDIKIQDAIKEMAERKGENLVVNFFVYIHDKKFKETLKNTTQDKRNKLFSPILVDKKILDIVSSNGKKIIGGTLGQTHYSLLITGNNLSRDLKKQIETRIEEILY